MRRKDLVARRCSTAEEVAAWVRTQKKGNGPNGPDGHLEERAARTTYAELAANAALVLIGVACTLLDRQMLKAGWLARVLYALERLAYTAARRVSGITKGMLQAYTDKGVPARKQVYFPNPVRVPDSLDSVKRGAFRQRMGFAEEEFVALYSGNLGVKQGLAILLEAAALCREPGVRIVICGDGAERAALEQRARELELTNVRFLPLQEKAEYEEMLVDADLCLITQQAGSGQFFFPSKLLTTLAFAKPVLVVADADSELALAVHEGACGFRAPPGAAHAMADALRGAQEQRDALPAMGRWDSVSGSMSGGLKRNGCLASSRTC